MAITKPIKGRIQALKAQYDVLRKGKDSLLVMIDEAEVPESVYNSNAIENSTLTLKETEKILLDIETTHPFCDGNGRIGRVLISYQLQRFGFPMIIIRDREKKEYYKSFGDYRDDKNTKTLEKVVYLGLMESLHKRITYLKGDKVIWLSEYTKSHAKSASAITNAARRQNIPAFREKGVWKISENFEYKTLDY